MYLVHIFGGRKSGSVIYVIKKEITALRVLYSIKLKNNARTWNTPNILFSCVIQILFALGDDPDKSLEFLKRLGESPVSDEVPPGDGFAENELIEKFHKSMLGYAVDR